MFGQFSSSFTMDRNLQTLIDAFNTSQRCNPAQSRRQFYPNSYVYPNMRPQPQQPTSLNIYQEKVTFTLLSNNTISSTLTNDTQDVILKISPNNKTLLLITIDRPARDPKEELESSNPYLPQSQQAMYKQKIEFKVEDNDDVEINGNDQLLTIVTKAQIKYQKNDQTKKSVQSIHPDILTKEETKQVSIHFKFLNNWYVKYHNSIQSAKKTLADYFKTWQLSRIRFINFEQQPPQEILAAQDQKKLKPDPPQAIVGEQEEQEQAPQISEKDLQNLFPPVSEDFIQKQKEALERKNMSFDEKIKRLFDEVRIKQFKTLYNNDKTLAYRCPYHKCSKSYRKPSQLRNHLKQNHQKLSEINFTIDDSGEYKFNEKALDYCLLIWKVYPNFVKQVINEMRQRKEQQTL